MKAKLVLTAFLWATLLIFWSIFVILYFPPLGEFHVYVLLAVISLITIAVIQNSGRGDAMTFISFFFVFVAFHFGIIPAAILDSEKLLSLGSIFRWYFSESYVREALNIALVFVFGYVGALFLVRPSPKRLAGDFTQVKKKYSQLYFSSILALLCGSWLAIVFFILGVTNYALYNEIARGGDLGFIGTFLTMSYPLIAVVFFLGVIYGDNIRITMSIFLTWGVIAFVTGLRGEVLFPLAMTAPMLVVQGRVKFRPIVFAVLIVGVLFSASFVRVYRNTVSFSDASEQTSVFMGIAELGGSLRPAYETVRWTQTGMMDFQLGSSYFAPFERVLVRVFPFAERVPAREDLRLMNVAIFELTNGGSYGFSIAAEAFINFGILGAFATGLFVGVAMLRFGRQCLLGSPSLLLIALIYALYYHVRQSFVGAFGSFVIVFIAGTIIMSFARKFHSATALQS